MKTFAAVFISSFILSYLLVPLFARISLRMGWVDRPGEEKKIHSQPIPTLGGIPLLFSVALPLLILFFWPNIPGDVIREESRSILGLLLGVILILLLGVYDDLYGADHRKKFVVQILAALLIYLFGYEIRVLSIPFGNPLILGVFALPVTILWVVGITNAINLIDGIDGLAAGVSFFVVATIFAVSLVFHQSLTAILALALCGGLLGFLRYNFYPARIFLGDSGSLVIGFMISAIAIQGSYKSATVVALAVPFLALGVPIMDTLLAIWRRASNRKPIFSGDQDHIHHRLIHRGMSQSRAAIMLYGLTAFFGLLAFLYTFSNSQEIALILLAFGIITVMIIQRLGYFARTRNENQSDPASDNKV